MTDMVTNVQKYNPYLSEIDEIGTVFILLLLILLFIMENGVSLQRW
jgi:hypothetical protein